MTGRPVHTPEPTRTRSDALPPLARVADVAETLPQASDGCQWYIDDDMVIADGEVIGHVSRDLIAGKQIWTGMDLEGRLAPRFGNRAFPTRQKAGAAVVEMVTDVG